MVVTVQYVKHLLKTIASFESYCTNNYKAWQSQKDTTNSVVRVPSYYLLLVIIKCRVNYNFLYIYVGGISKVIFVILQYFFAVNKLISRYTDTYESIKESSQVHGRNSFCITIRGMAGPRPF